MLRAANFSLLHSSITVAIEFSEGLSQGELMKYLSLITILVSWNTFAGEWCAKNKSSLEEQHKHFIYSDSINEKNVLNTQELSSEEFEPYEISTKVRLKLIGFERYRGGEQVIRDIERARNKFEKVLATPAFKNLVLNHKYRGEFTYKRNSGKTNNEIFEMILAGADKYDRTVDNEIDMVLCPYYSSKKVLGYTYPNRKEVWLNFKYYRDKFNNFNVNSITGNLLHEWIHNTGFGHAKKRNKTRDLTVPYAIGYMARDVAGKLD